MGHPRFVAAARGLGLDIEIQVYPESARSAQDAAAAVGCELAEIVKSLVFEADGSACVVLVEGVSRVDERRLAAELRAADVRRADPATVRAATGFAIGGVPPFGHATSLPVLIDAGVLDHEIVWAAAGTPHSVFAVAPLSLVAAAGATVVHGLATRGAA
jgi:prolyl-tRNA editing enzyme YbaK/EbsC (Cys-tRNA(Pro) deacylase)